MIQLLSKKILAFITRNTKIPIDETDVYKYGIEITISSVLNIVLIIILSLLLGNFVSGICFLFCFILLRQFTGGYHAESYFKCNLALGVSYVCISLISNVFSRLPIHLLEGLLIAGCITVVLYAPVNNRHKQLTSKQKQQFKTISLIIYALLGIVSVILKILNIYIWTVMALTLLLVSLMIIIEILMQKEGYHES